MDKNSKKMISGAFILGLGTFIAKLLGAAYRIPLTKIIGGTGLGLYQMVFPVYTLLLDFSGAGVPNAVAKIISSYKGLDREVYARKILKISLIFFSALGAFLSVLTALFSGAVATAQGNADARLSYVFLSPSVVAVCAICCFRGYFQGFMNMTHTAVSQIVEQVVKLIAGLTISSLFMPDIPKAVAGAALAITLSEFIALTVLSVTYGLKKKRLGFTKLYIDKEIFSSSIKNIFSYVIPIAFAGMMLPLSKVADSFLIVNFLSENTANPTAVYGIFSGVVTTVIGLPVAVCYGVSAVAVPMVASANAGKKNKDAVKTILLTLVISVPCAILLAVFAPLVIRILFGYLSTEEKSLSINLLRLTSVCVVLLSLLQTLNGVLIGKGNPKKPMIGMAAGVAVKILIEVFTLKIPEIGIYGAGIGAIACYFVADLVNLSMVFPIKFKRKINESSRVKIGRSADL